MYTGLDDGWTFGRIFSDATDFPFGTCVIFYLKNKRVVIDVARNLIQGPQHYTEVKMNEDFSCEIHKIPLKLKKNPEYMGISYTLLCYNERLDYFVYVILFSHSEPSM